jgi:hypothetical protein
MQQSSSTKGMQLLDFKRGRLELMRLRGSQRCGEIGADQKLMAMEQTLGRKRWEKDEGATVEERLKVKYKGWWPGGFLL